MLNFLKKYLKKTKKFFLTRKLLSLCLVFFILILVFRLFYALQHIYVGQDTARDLYLMKEFHKENLFFISYGPKTSIGNFKLPPFIYQISYWISVLTNHNPYSILIFTIIVESFTPVLLLLWMRYIFKGNITPLLIAISYAFFSHVVTYSTMQWNPSMIPFFTILMLYCYFKNFNDGSKWPIILGTFSFSITCHLHYQAATLIPFVVIFFLWSMYKDKNALYWIIGVLISLIFFIPYLAAESVYDWKNTRAILRYFNEEHSLYFNRVSLFQFGWSFLPVFFERVVLGYNIFYPLLGKFLFYIGMFVLIISAWKNKNRRLLLIYILSIFVMLRLYKGDINDYYMLIIFSLPAIYLGLIMEKYKKLFIFSVIILVFFSLLNLNKNIVTNDFKSLNHLLDDISAKIPEKKARFIFHDDDYINIFAYAISEHDGISIDQNSPYVVDVCRKRSLCMWNKIPVCSENRGYTYAALFKNKAGYTFIDRFSDYSLNYKIIIGKIKNPHVSMDEYPLHVWDYYHGTDTILPEIYVK